MQAEAPKGWGQAASELGITYSRRRRGRCGDVSCSARGVCGYSHARTPHCLLQQSYCFLLPPPTSPHLASIASLSFPPWVLLPKCYRLHSRIADEPLRPPEPDHGLT